MVLGGGRSLQGSPPAAGRESCEPARRPAHGRRQALRHRLLLRAADEDRGRRPLAASARAVRGARARGRAAIDDPAYVPALQALCEQHGVGAVLPLTDLDIEVLAPRARAGPAARARALQRGRPRDVRQVRDAPAARAPWAALAADRPARRGPRGARLPGDGQAAPRLGRALDPPRARPRAGALLRRLRARADDGAARDERPGALDRLPRRPRRALPERDPAHDARVARRRVDQGRR